ncbi:MAG TPA: amidase [Solirubrobacter sp.]|nr:amidase [Solirubrobacter sp.]
MNAVELRAAFAAGELSPVETIDAAAEHAELGAFITLTLDEAREQARAAERAYADGTARPLEGLTLAVKDLFDTAGVRTTYGSSIYADHVPDADAELVRRAKEAGAIVVGKTLTHEFAWGITSVNPHFPPCRNPYDPERVPGGSSGGSAVALATGAAALALGTDTGGSIRIPAAFCGVSGLKPTFGRLSLAGVHPLAPTLDHSGPMARTPADVRLFWEALTGLAARASSRGASCRLDATANSPKHRPLGDATIAVCPDLHVRPLEPGIQRAFDAAVAAIDAIEVGFDAPEHLYATYAPIQNAEAAKVHAEHFPSRRDEYGADVAHRLDMAAKVTLGEYIDATIERERIRAAFGTLFTHCDLLLTPISAVPPEPIAQPTHQQFRDGVLPYTVPQDLAGLPTCAVPVGFDDGGLPVGVQLTGPPLSEARVLAGAEMLYAATASARAESASRR